jgi:monofunctional biosynthetic peptidoglycan transglycosylase
MAVTLKKSFLVKLALLGMLLILFTPIYMYFSHDVDELKSSYPETLLLGDSVSYEMRPKKPKSWSGLREISKAAKWAIILSEDWAFYQHEGVDFEQMKIALKDMVEEKKFRGASTITQQMVKNVYLTERRTLWRKLHEIILAQKVERALTKDRILEIYLNVIEFGPGIYGIKNASHHYFRKSPVNLTPREGAFLAMLLPSPKRYYLSFRKKKLTHFARARIHAILIKMRMGKIISPLQYEEERIARMSWEKSD